MVIIIIGPPGSGKSTQSKLIEKDDNADWVSIGRLLRDMKDPKLQAEMDKGKLLDDDLVNSVLANHLKSISSDKLVIVDGFPRRASQAQWLVDYIHQTGHKLGAVIHIVLDRQTAQERLKQRGRTDDNISSIDARFDEYRSDVLPLVGFFNSCDVPVYEIDGVPSAVEVHKVIGGIIEDVYQN